MFNFFYSLFFIIFPLFYFFIFFIINKKTLTVLMFIAILLTTSVILFITKKNIILKNKIILVYFSFLGVFYFFFNTNSFLFFFLTYEFFLITSYFFLKQTNLNKRSFNVLIFFLLWTQLSSFIIFLLLTYVFFLTKSLSFLNIYSFIFTKKQIKILQTLTLFGFGIKIPLLPFSFWLTKTHVEANTSFSIFLSSILIKTAFFGFFKLNFIFFSTKSVYIFLFFLICITITPFLLIIQIDFKKFIAYTTVQEMSIFSVFLIYFDNTNNFIFILFILLHVFSSILFFLIIDFVYLRFNTRVCFLFYGISFNLPKLNTLIVLFFIFLLGIPFTLKFFFEFLFLLKIYKTVYFFFLFFIFFTQFLTVLIVSKNILMFLYGSRLKKINKDLCLFDFLIVFIVFFPLLIFLC